MIELLDPIDPSNHSTDRLIIPSIHVSSQTGRRRRGEVLQGTGAGEGGAPQARRAAHAAAHAPRGRGRGGGGGEQARELAGEGMRGCVCWGILGCVYACVDRLPASPVLHPLQPHPSPHKPYTHTPTGPLRPETQVALLLHLRGQRRHQGGLPPPAAPGHPRALHRRPHAPSPGPIRGVRHAGVQCTSLGEFVCLFGFWLLEWFFVGGSNSTDLTAPATLHHTHTLIHSRSTSWASTSAGSCRPKRAGSMWRPSTGRTGACVSKRSTGLTCVCSRRMVRVVLLWRSYHAPSLTFP